MRRILRLSALAIALHSLMLAAGSTQLKFATVSRAEAEQAAVLAPNREFRASMWIWSDKYVYQPGQQLTLRFTARTNGDLIPYTIVAYRQNNQTGEKIYAPAGTDTPTDVFGNTPEQGFQITRLQDVEKAVLAGAGGLIPAVPIPGEFGMHTIVIEIRDYTGATVVKRLYQKIGVVERFETFSGAVEAGRTLTNNIGWNLSGTVFVRNAELTIEPGTFIIGQPGSNPPSALVVTRGARLIAEGTRSRPIIFTSSLPVGQRRPGDWGGLAIAGRAPTNEAGGEGTVEGLPAGEDSRYGGDDPTWDCGVFRYIRIEFGGAELEPDREINGIGWASCGSDTVIDHLQSHYPNDDAFEWFGGSANAKYLVATGGNDDMYDIQLGYTGKVQFFAGIQYPDVLGDMGIEADGNETNFTAQPFTDPVLYNATFLGNPAACGGSCDGARLRRGLKGHYNNLVFHGFFDDTIDVRDAPTIANLGDGSLSSNGILAWGNEGETGGANTLAVQFSSSDSTLQFANGTIGTGRNVRVADPKFRSLVLSDWDLRGGEGSPLDDPTWELPPDDGFFDQSARCGGAFCGTEDWTEEWTNKIMETDLSQ